MTKKDKHNFVRPGRTNKREFKVAKRYIDEETGIVSWSSEIIKIPTIKIPKLNEKKENKASK